MTQIPLFRPDLPPPSAWTSLYKKAIKSGQLTNFGDVYKACVRNLEHDFGGHWVLTSNGTSALEIACQMIPKHIQRVGVPDFTFAATAQAVIRAGKTPVIMGCGDDLGPVSSGDLMAVLLVSSFGYYSPSNTKIASEVRARGGFVIWDNAGAFPNYSERDITCYSLHAAKSLPIGEGGMIRFPKAEQKYEAMQIMNFGFNHQRESVMPMGFNAKLDELHCCVLLAQLDRYASIREVIAWRVQLIRHYESMLSQYCMAWPSEMLSMSAPSMIVLRLPRTQEILEAGAQRGITFRRYYHPLLSDQLAFAGFDGIAGRSAESLSKCLALPRDVTDNEIERVVECINDVLQSSP